MEEGSELLERIQNGGKLPLLTSCSPGWINFMEKYYPEVMEHVSTVKSPQQCFGSLAKTYFAQKVGINPRFMKVVSIMPCAAKKIEAARPEFNTMGKQDVDVVLTTREFARLMKREGMWLPDLPDTPYEDMWMDGYSGAAELFGTTGGVMEAALRTVYKLVVGKELEESRSRRPAARNRSRKRSSIWEENTER
jgi:ferredoxin hydrogenase gamma subunit